VVVAVNRAANPGTDPLPPSMTDEQFLASLPQLNVG